MEIKDGSAYLSKQESLATGYQSPIPVDHIDAMDLLGTFNDREQLIIELQCAEPELLLEQRAQIPRLLHELNRDRPLVDKVAQQIIEFSADQGLKGLR